MKNYYVNKNAQRNGDHEVHEANCTFLPKPENRDFLGIYSDCKGAVKKAKEDYNRVNGCYYCCSDCHTS